MCCLLFVEVAHLILHLLVFSSNDRSFAIEMADLINYDVTVRKSVVLLFLVQTAGSRANWPQYMNIDPSISQWRVADLTWPDLARDENIEASLTSIYHVRARQWRCGLITMTEAGAWGIFTDLLGKRSGWINGLEKRVLLATTGGGGGGMWKVSCRAYGVKMQTQSKRRVCVGLQQKWLQEGPLQPFILHQTRLLLFWHSCWWDILHYSPAYFLIIKTNWIRTYTLWLLPVLSWHLWWSYFGGFG